MKHILLLGLFVCACGKGKAPTTAVPSSTTTGEASVEPAGSAVGDDAGDAMDAREAAQWAAAKEGDPEELMRLADLVGCQEMRERAERVELRPTAIVAMQYCHDFSELPWLAQQALDGSDADAKAALESAVALAARPRRATDPEDADDLHNGCTSLLGLARAMERPRDRRVLAIRALRMLAEYGCVKRADVPTDLDVH
jgi:hypothetical protein